MLHSDLINDIKSFSKDIKINKKADWKFLSYNPAAFHLLERNPDNIDWGYFSENTGVPLNYYLKYQDKIDWKSFSRNRFYTHFNFDLSYLAQNIYAITPDNEKLFEQIGCWDELSVNPAAIYLLQKNEDKLNWDLLSQNPAAVHLLNQNPDKVNWNIACCNYAMPVKKINWEFLSSNAAAINLLGKNLNKVNWNIFPINYAAASLLEENLDKVNWKCMSVNPSAVHLLEEKY